MPRFGACQEDDVGDSYAKIGSALTPLSQGLRPFHENGISDLVDMRPDEGAHPVID